MLTREQKCESEELIQKLRRHEVVPEPKHYEQAKQIEKQWQKFEEEKNRDCSRMIADGCKEAAADVDKYITREAITVSIKHLNGCIQDGEKRTCNECGGKFQVRYAIMDWCLACYVKHRLYLIQLKWGQFFDRTRRIRIIESCPICLIKRIAVELRKELNLC